MPPEPGRVSEMCAVTPSKRSCSVSRNPVFIASAITSVATPAITPRMLNAVTSRSTAGRFGDRKYRRATNHSNRIRKTRLSAVTFGFHLGFARSRLYAAWCFGTKLREQDDVADGMRIGEQHRQAIDSNSFARRRWQTVAKCANVVHIQLLWYFIASLLHLRQEAPLLFGGI